MKGNMRRAMVVGTTARRFLFREEMRPGAAASRTALFSSATGVGALVGPLIVPAPFYQSLALGVILVVLASLAATLTLLRAALALLGRRVNFLAIPDKAQTKQAFLLMKEKFSIEGVNPARFLSPAKIVVSGDLDAPKVVAGMERLQ